MNVQSRYIQKWSARTITVAGLLLLVAYGSAAAANGANNFRGRFATSYHGFDASITGTVDEPNPPAIPYAVSGTMTSDGRGDVAGFLNVDYGSPGTGSASTCSISGNYTVGTAPVGDATGFVTLNLTSSCETVTCTGTTVPTCTATGSASAGSPVELFCALSGAANSALDCTEMGEAASGTTFQTPIEASHWEK
jgi:hypothetical protein